MKNFFSRIISRIKGTYQVVTLAICAAVISVMAPAIARAEPSLTLPSTVDLSALFPYASAIIAALVTLIVIRKAIKLSNRS